MLVQLWQLFQMPFKNKILKGGPALTQLKYYNVFRSPLPHKNDVLIGKRNIYNPCESTLSKIKNPLKMYPQNKNQKKHTGVVQSSHLYPKRARICWLKWVFPYKFVSRQQIYSSCLKHLQQQHLGRAIKEQTIRNNRNRLVSHKWHIIPWWSYAKIISFR